MNTSTSIPQILPKSPLFTDHRLLNVRHNEYAYSAVAPANLQEWEQRKAFTISQVKMAAGLWPEIPVPPQVPKIWGHEPYEGTVIAKVALETLPGLKLTGNLYFPGRLQSPAPAILCPHGHWRTGRIHHDERGSIPMRCLMLARLGFVVFSYDMVGYNDNDELLHGWSKDLDAPASLYGVSTFGLQTWNSLRAADLLCSLPEVDASRLGCTGASGGASQTWTVALLDERIKVLAPVCMLSSHYQGGCQCEEGPLLRLNGVTSFDILAALAPRPVLLPSVTRDWTNLLPRYEFPELQKVYRLFQAEKNIVNFHRDAEHNYDQCTRERIYPWFTHWLLNQALRENLPEDKIPPPPPELLLHHPEPHQPTPQSCRDALQKIQPYYCANALFTAGTKNDFAAWQKERRQQLSAILNNDLHLQNIAVRVTLPKWTLRDAEANGWLISRRDTGDIISAVWLNHPEPNPKYPTFILLAEQSKNVFFSGGTQSALLDTILGRKCNTLVIEMLGSGESAPMLERSPRDESTATFHAFNPSLFSMRVQDILTSIQLLRENGITDLVLAASGEAARTALCALPLTAPLSQVFLDLDGIADNQEGWLSQANYQPMIMKIGGLRGCLMLSAENNLTLCRPDPELAKVAEMTTQLLPKSARLSLSKDSILTTISKFLGRN